MIARLLTAAVPAAAPPGSYFGMPRQASTLAPFVDTVYEIVTWILVAFFLVIVFFLVLFSWKYRRRTHVADTGGPTHNTPLEVTWTVIPLILVIVIFYVGLRGYVYIMTPPENAYVVDVTAQRWSWTFQYPNSATETNLLHVPRGRPVLLRLRSDDVIHSLFIPAFRVKQDAVPGRRTPLWFEATTEGTYDLYCAEYCGKDHSLMRGSVRVYDPNEFEVVIEEAARWIDKVSDERLHLAGALLYNQCASCHTLDGGKLIGPSFRETYDLFKTGGSRTVRGGSTVKVDEAYLRHSIESPLDQIAAETATGTPYPSSMPPGIGRLLGERKTLAMIRFIQRLDEVAPGGKLVEVSREDIVLKNAPEGP
jgi:cytochrome c oxidase subunit 2